MKYRANIYQDVKDFFQENGGKLLTDQDIDNMGNEEVLTAWLEWNGIIGYASTIIQILNAPDYQ